MAVITRHDAPTTHGLWLRLLPSKTTPERLLEGMGLRLPPIDIRNVASRLGASVVEVSNPGWAGAVRSTIDGYATIWVRSEDDEAQKRLAIAHGIGRLATHSPAMEASDANIHVGTKNSTATTYAVRLLMPAATLIEEVHRLGGPNIPELARRFMVPEHAMAHRLAAVLQSRR